MEKRKTGNAPFYAAMAVCLLAAGVGTWQLLRPGAGQTSTAGRDTVGAVSQLPAQTSPALPAAQPDNTGRGQADAAPVSGTASVPRDEATGLSSDAGGSDHAPAAASGGTAGSTAKDGGTAGKSAGGASGGGDASGGTTGGGEASGNTTGGRGASGGTTEGGGNTSGGSPGSGKTGTARTSPLDGTAAAAFSMERLQYNETLGDWRTHDGLDITADLGTAVAAACAGTVTSVTEDPLMGVTVTLQHEGGYETTYAGLQETSREAGDELPAGGIVGTVGDTAAAESYLGPHLHFSVRHGGVPMDPEEFLSGA